MGDRRSLEFDMLEYWASLDTSLGTLISTVGTILGA
jgi:hypothetical protein